VWHPSLPYLGVCRKADIFVAIINSLEGSMGDEFSNIDTWGIINTFYARVFGIYSLCANRVGEESLENRRARAEASSEKTKTGKKSSSRKQTGIHRFWGGSEIVNPYGKTIAKAALYEPAQIFGEISRDLLRKKRILLPYLRNDDPYFTHRELERILYGKKWNPEM
jgi:predicted amidohydrolase